MDFRATKDDYERETDEAERLVRPSPKIKPSRHDKKREDMQTEDEPDPDLKGDPDMSLNYKSVGGSVALRVIARFLRADLDRADTIKVRRKDTGKVTDVSPETLQGPKKDEYESIDGDEEQKAKEKPEAEKESPEAKAPKGEKPPVDLTDAGRSLWDAAEDDPKLKSVLKTLADPESEAGGFAATSPDLPAQSLLKGVALPEGVKTLGDLQKALMKGKAKKPSPGEKPAPKKPGEPEKEVPPKKEEPAKPDPVAEKLDRLISVMERFMAQAPASAQPAIKQEIAEAKKTVEEQKPAEAPPADESVDVDVSELAVPPEQAPKEQPPVPTGKPVPKSKKPKEKAEKPPKAETRNGPQGIAEPKRRKITKDESGALLAHRNFPHSGLATRVMNLNLHPDDVNEIIRHYHQMKAVKIKPEDLDDAIEQSRAIYVTDPTKIPHPAQGQNTQGKIKNWDDLTPDEQSEVYAQHRNTVVAASMALRERVTDALMMKSQIPRALAETLADSKLSPTQGTPEEQEEKGRQVAQKIYETVLASGEQPEPIDDESVQKTLERTKGDPVAQRAAVAYFQARDYLAARDKFLSTTSGDQIDERDPPRVLASTLLNATRYLQQRAKRYPEAYRGANDAAEKFRNRVMMRLRTNFPEKATQIEPQIQAVEADEWDEKSKLYDDLQAKRDKGLRKYKREYDKAKQAYEADMASALGSYRDSADPEPVKSIDDRLRDQKIFLPPEPDPIPPKPIGYDEVRKGPQGLRSMGKRLMDKLLRRRTASLRVTARFHAYSTCEAGETMGNPSSSPKNATGRTAVYWGVDPAAQYPGPYSRGDQVHARDLSETDFDVILTAAKQWLKSSVLSTAIEGIVPDTQFRAALDLAIRDLAGGRYSVGLHPTLYNRLLARLAGKPETETLLTVREASSGSLYARAPEEERHMSASATIRKFAATIADANPGIAFDLTNLAFKLAEDEEQKDQGQDAAAKQAGEMPEAFKEHMKEKADDKDDDKGQDQGQKQASYKTLKASVIAAAQANPALRQAFLPVLKTIKQIG